MELLSIFAPRAEAEYEEWTALPAATQRRGPRAQPFVRRLAQLGREGAAPSSANDKASDAGGTTPPDPASDTVHDTDDDSLKQEEEEDLGGGGGAYG